MSREYIAKTLKRLRERSGLTADQVGALVGKSGKTVNAWENNRGQPDAEILMQLCDIYDVTDVLSEFRDTDNTIKKAPTESVSENDSQKQRLLENYEALNPLGRSKLVDYSDDLADSLKYTEVSIETTSKKEA